MLARIAGSVPREQSKPCRSFMQKPIVVVGSINLDLVVGAERIPQVGETIIGEAFSAASVELHLTTGRELFEADFVYLMTVKPL